MWGITMTHDFLAGKYSWKCCIMKIVMGWKSFIGSVLLCVMKGWFSSELRLGSKNQCWLCVVVCHAGLVFIKTLTWVKKSVMDPSCQHNFLADTNSHRDITNRNEPLLFFHMDPTNSIVWTRKSFIGSVLLCVVQGWFSSKLLLGSKNQWWIPAVSMIPCGHQQPQGHNKQEWTTFILLYGSNKQHCMDKEEFH